MKDHNEKNFWLSWFCIACGILLIGGIIWLPIPEENKANASLALGFITGNLIGLPLAYIFGGNPVAKKPNEPTEPITDLRTETLN